jgi:hypothetical protein
VLGHFRVFLLDLCGISHERDAISLYNEYFPDDPLPKGALLLLRAALPKQSSTNDLRQRLFS